MGLLAPLSALLALPLAAAIVVLYLLKLKRKERIVSSVFLWRHAIQDVQANAPFQKLRKNLLLFIQLGVLILAILALSRPFARTTGLTGQNIVIIIDSSASMQSTDVGKSRFDQAKRLALTSVDHMGRGDSMLVITSAAKTRVVSSFTSDKKALSTAIASLSPCDTRANLREAVVLALSLVSKKKNPQIVIISDGGFAPIADIRSENAKVQFLKVGESSDNVAIVAMDARKTLSGTQQVFVGLRNFSKRKRDFNLEFYLDDQLNSIRQESLAAGESKQEILSDLPASGGRLTVKLDMKDDLQADNVANVYLTSSKRLSTLIVSSGNLFLEHAFSLNQDIEAELATTTPSDLSHYDLIVFDGITPPDNLPRGSYILINASCKSAPAKLGSIVSNPSIADWSKNHPVTAYVDFSTIRMEKAHSLTLTNWGQGLVECEAGTIAAAGENDGRRFVMLGWSLQESDFPLRVAFPIFIANSIEWLAGSRSDINNIAVRTGDVVPLDTQGESKMDVTDPNGNSATISCNGSSYFDGADKVGIYRIKLGKKEREIACNLLAPEESDTSPRGDIKIGERQVERSKSGIKTNREYWRVILLFGLALLSFEWYAFHRRLG